MNRVECSLAKTVIRALVAIGFFASVGGNALPSLLDAQSIETVSGKPAPRDLETLVRQLDSSSFRQREQAERTLTSLGMTAVRPVVQQLVDGPPESAMRAARILQRVGGQASEVGMTRIAVILHYLGNSGYPHLVEPAEQVAELWKAEQLERTIGRIKSFGIDVHSLDGDLIGDRIIIISRSGDLSGENQSASQKSARAAPPRREDRPSSRELLKEVDAILAESGEQFESRLEATLSRSNAGARRPGNENPLAANATILLDGRMVHLDGATSNSWSVTIDADATDAAEGMGLLKLLPSVSCILFRERNVSKEELEVLASIPGLRAVTLERCKYDAPQMLDFIARHANIQVTSTGHDAFLGVSLQTAADELALAFGDEKDAPIREVENRPLCRVMTVVAGTAAANAGIVEGDAILELDNYPITSFNEMVIIIASHQPGDEIPVKIRHDGETRDETIQLGQRPPDQ